MGDREHVPAQRRVLGIDLGGASSDTTGYAVLEGSDLPALLAAGRPTKASSPAESEEVLLALVDEWTPAAVAIDAPLTLPPCLTCPSYCRGPGSLCELRAAQAMWSAGRNPVSQRPCEVAVHERLGEWPLPTMQLGVITARAVAFARRLASRGVPPSVLERGEVLEVYPRATQRRLEPRHPDLRPRAKGEAKVVYGQRVVAGFEVLIDGIDPHRAEFKSGHVLDALTAAYTGWLGLGRLEAPPPGFNLASGWIWMPRTTEGAPAAVIDPDVV